MTGGFTNLLPDDSRTSAVKQAGPIGQM